MITPIEDLLREIDRYADTPDLAQFALDLSGDLPMEDGHTRAMLMRIADNLRGLQQALYSARHHLSVKALDSV